MERVEAMKKGQKDQQAQQRTWKPAQPHSARITGPGNAKPKQDGAGWVNKSNRLRTSPEVPEDSEIL